MDILLATSQIAKNKDQKLTSGQHMSPIKQSIQKRHFKVYFLSVNTVLSKHNLLCLL